MEEVFLDKHFRVGTKGDNGMMWAAMSCKHFWCVLTKEFVQEWYPMRELMVGYIRHIQEQGKEFTLILDSVWMNPMTTSTPPSKIWLLESSNSSTD